MVQVQPPSLPPSVSGLLRGTVTASCYRVTRSAVTGQSLVIASPGSAWLRCPTALNNQAAHRSPACAGQLNNSIELTLWPLVHCGADWQDPQSLRRAHVGPLRH